jgi:hypothetical protein
MIKHHPPTGSTSADEQLAWASLELSRRDARIAKLEKANQRLVNAKMPQDGWQWAHFAVVANSNDSGCISYVNGLVHTDTSGKAPFTLEGWVMTDPPVKPHNFPTERTEP